MKKSKKELIKIPGVIIEEIINYNETFNLLRLNLIKQAYLCTLLAQISIFRPTAMSPRKLKECSSVKAYIKLITNSSFAKYVQATVAIKRTIKIYAGQSKENNILEDFEDLTFNNKGPASLRDGKDSIFISPESARKYRRGLMLQIAGYGQSKPIHNPKEISTSLKKINPDNFRDYLSIECSDSEWNEILESLKADLSQVHFIENLNLEGKEIKDNLVPLESRLTKKRAKIQTPTAIETSKKDPQWMIDANK